MLLIGVAWNCHAGRRGVRSALRGRGGRPRPARVDRLPVRRHRVGLDAAEAQQVLDQAVQALCLGVDQVQQPSTQLVVEGVLLVEHVGRGAADRGERGAQVVGHRTQQQRAVAVERHEAGRVVALAAAILAGDMGESRVDQRRAAFQRRGLAQPPAGQRADLMTCRAQTADEEPADQPRGPGDRDPHAGSGSVRLSGTGPSPA